MFSFFFLVLLFSFFNLSSLSQTANNSEECFQYILQNECTTFLEVVSIKEREQKDFFDQEVSLTVSDVRMRRPNCRRAFLSYYCQLMFGGFICQSSSSSSSSSSLEEQRCLEEEYCFQVTEDCPDDFPLLNCTTFSPSPSPSPSPFSTINCEKEVKEQIKQAQEEPVAVQTCLNGEKETIECCLGLFIKDDNDECVIECPQFLYGESFEFGMRIFTLVLMLLVLLVLLIATVPFVVVTDMSYPNFVLFIAFYSLTFANLMNLWVIFEGAGPYICGGEKNYINGLKQFGDSPRTLAQFFIWFFLINLSSANWALFAFNLFCNAARPYTSKFEKFIGKPVPLSIVIGMEGGCIIFALIGPLVLLFLSLFGPKEFYFPLPVVESPFPISLYAKRIYLGCLLFGGVVSTVFLVLAAVLLLKRGRQIIYFQWRSLVAGSYSLIVELLIVILISIPFAEDIDVRLDYIECIASHPRISPTPCEDSYHRPYFIISYNSVILGLFLFALFATFITHNLVQKWWKELIFERKILTDYIEYERLG